MAARQRGQGAGTDPGKCVLFNLIKILIIKYFDYRNVHEDSSSAFEAIGEREDEKFPQPPSLDYLNA